MDPPGARLDEINLGSLVPDDKIPPQHVHDHEHVERVHHGIEAATKMGAHIIAVVPVQPHGHLQLAKVFRQIVHPHTGAEIGAVKIQEPAQSSRGAGKAG